ncbi:23S rRNA pseudouridine(1911/1915/1917) synthase RluD [Thiocystis violacea]|uniref:23S rRNA pseudouridine(1911/1915/1917) synthase RluD n=1 Tax=Thiocystis violacea TaxID=13725 RepID=UPI001902DD69|nr:23S rRNA pseudouridine(1911/1915/1917) synthase RluD [Thiocystis violacea]MBK1720994.1 23S rRNA pseudouridine(1911/1915/1917) synthase [Thiocystis violacea]
MSGSPTETLRRVVTVDASLAGSRLDQALATLLPEFSRSRLQQWIEAGQVLVDETPRRCRDKVWGGESVRVQAELAASEDCQAQAIALDLVYEDAQLLVINKPAGLVVHPAAGNRDGTLQNALLHHAPSLATLPRAGIVHRLDKDTSGLLVVAKTLQAHKSLVEQLQARQVHREYRALVVGNLVAGGRVEAPIGRHPTQRTKMAVVPSGREAVTHFRVLAAFPGHALLAVELETGRTHQIRVHMAHIRHPLVGDRAYGARPRPPAACHPDLTAALQGFPRQALHAIRLGLVHPETGAQMHWEVPMAEDLEGLLKLFRQEVAGGADSA